MINIHEVLETNDMIEKENLDVRTITLGISLLSCCDNDLDRLIDKIYNRITTVAKDLVETGKAIEKEFGIPIVNKRISVTPIALVGASAASASSERVGFGSRRNENVCFCFQDYSFTVLPALCFMARLRFYPAIRFPVDRRCRRGNHLFRAEVAARTVSAAGGELPVRCAEVRQTYYFLFL